MRTRVRRKGICPTQRSGAGISGSMGTKWMCTAGSFCQWRTSKSACTPCPPIHRVEAATITTLMGIIGAGIGSKGAVFPLILIAVTVAVEYQSGLREAFSVESVERSKQSFIAEFGAGPFLGNFGESLRALGVA